jgi:hypothetical protein
MAHTPDSIRDLIRNDSTGIVACRAVCAIYRQQTMDEKKTADTRHDNSRGFSQAHAKVGTDLVRWMCDDESGVFKRRCGGSFPRFFRENSKWIKNTSAYAGRERMEVATEIALHYAEQLSRIANGELADSRKAA